MARHVTVALLVAHEDVEVGDWLIDSDNDIMRITGLSGAEHRAEYWTTDADELQAYLVGRRELPAPGTGINYAPTSQQSYRLIQPTKALVRPPHFSSVEEAERWLEEHAR